MSGVDFLDKLLDGVAVEWKRLADVAKYSDARIDCNGVNKNNYVGVDNLLQNRAGKTESSYVPTEGRLIEYRPGDVLIGNIRPYLKKIWLANQAGGTNGDVLVIRPAHQSLSSGYLHQVLTDENFFDYNMQHAKGAKMPRGDKAKIIEYKIPIPCPDNPKKSLEIQAEIVRILDAFTSLTAELTAELTARKKQYNHYRDQLLSFEEGEVEWKALGEVAQYSKTRISFEKLDETNYVGVDNLLQNRAGKSPSSYVPTSGNLTEYRKNDILIGNIRPYLKKIWQSDCVGGTNGDVLVLRGTDSSVNPRYLYQVLADDNFFDYNMQHAKGAKMPRGSKEEILKYQIPVPSPEEQARIVAILDKFDAITHSLTEGLPREIELRQKQYAHYRDLLLSFPKPEEVAA